MKKKIPASCVISCLAISVAVAQEPNRDGSDESQSPDAQEDVPHPLANPAAPEDGGLPSYTATGSDDEVDVPFVTSPEEVVQRMLALGEVGRGDYVIDLGSGDGRIVIAAAQEGAYGLGVDIDPDLVRESRANAADADVDDRVIFLEQDLFDTDISQASVVTMYLLQEINLELRPRLLEELRPGTRVVSHSFHMGEWEPDRRERVGLGQDGSWRVIYAWVIPADVSGQWQWQIGDRRFDWRVEQQFQELETTLETAGASLSPENVELHGRRVSFTADHDGTRYVFNGRAEDGRIEGVAQVHSADQARVHEWSAERTQ